MKVKQLMRQDMNPSDRLEQAITFIAKLEDSGVSRYQIWQECDIPEATLGRWLHRKVKNVDKDKFAKLKNYAQSKGISC